VEDAQSPHIGEKSFFVPSRKLTKGDGGFFKGEGRREGGREGGRASNSRNLSLLTGVQMQKKRRREGGREGGREPRWPDR
jgi:hypothetical protein